MIQVLGDRVLVALPPEPEETTSASGLVLVRDPDRLKTPTCGLVVRLGEKTGAVTLDAVLRVLDEQQREDDWLYDETVAAVKRLAPAPFDVAVGDQVLFASSSGEQVRLDGVNYVILREDDILGVVEKEAAA